MTTAHHDPNSRGDAAYSQAKRLLPRLILVWTLAVVALIALAAGFMNFDDIDLIWDVPFEAVTLVVLCTAMMDLIYAARWRLWLRIADPHERFRLGRLWTFVTWSRFGSQFLPIPAVSVAIRAAAVKSTSTVSTRRAVGSVAVDPILDLYQFALVLPITAALLTGYLDASQAVWGVGVVLACGAALLTALFPMLVRLFESARSFVRQTLSQTITPSAALPNIDQRTILTAYGLTVLRYAFVVARLWAIALSVGLTELTASFFAATGTVTQAAHMATVTPGALGVLEGGWFAALRAAGVSAHHATLFVTAQRIFIWLAIAALASVLTAIYFAVAVRTRGHAKETPTARPTASLPGVAAS